MDPVLILLVILGLCVGSFLNVLITRLPDPERSLLNPLFSACPQCNAPVRARDNIPVLGYVLLHGRCRDCKGRIGIFYPVIEVTTAALVVVAYLLHGPTLAAVTLASFLILLLATAATDARTYLIPDLYTLGGALLGLGFTFLSSGWPLASRHAADAFLIAFLLWALGFVVGRMVGKEALGFGDVLLVGMMATFLGFGATVVAIYAAAVSGVLFYVVHRRLNSERLVPFGLHLAIGGAFVALIGSIGYATLIERLLPWY